MSLVSRPNVSATMSLSSARRPLWLCQFRHTRHWRILNGRTLRPRSFSVFKLMSPRNNGLSTVNKELLASRRRCTCWNMSSTPAASSSKMNADTCAMNPQGSPSDAYEGQLPPASVVEALPTKLSNPHYPPEIHAIANFTVAVLARWLASSCPQHVKTWPSHVESWFTSRTSSCKSWKLGILLYVVSADDDSATNQPLLQNGVPRNTRPSARTTTWTRLT